MGKKVIHYCDACGREVGNYDDLIDIDLPHRTWELELEYDTYEICEECHSVYMTCMQEVRTKVFSIMKG